MAFISKKGQTVRAEAREVIRRVITICDREAGSCLQLALHQSDLRVANYTGISLSSVKLIREGVEDEEGQSIQNEARGIIRRVIEICDEESKSRSIQYLLKQSNLRVANYTGVSVRTVTTIRKEGVAAGSAPLRTPGTKRPYSKDKKCHLSENDKVVIEDMFNDLYQVQKKTPPAETVLMAVKEKIYFPWRVHTLLRLLMDMELRRQRKKKKEEVNPSVTETLTSTWSKDDSTSSMPIVPTLDSEESTSKRNVEEISIKQEGVKEELILEDYGDPIDSMEFQSSEEAEGFGNLKEDPEMAHSSSSAGEEGPFETIICESGDVKIKQEIFEDESEGFSNPIAVDPISTWSDTTVKESSAPLFSEIPQCALPRNIDYKTTIKARSPLNKSLKQISKRQVRSSETLQKAVPSLGVEKCQICVNEVFSSPSDLVEHCILRHSDASSRFFPAVEPSSQQLLSDTASPGLKPTAMQSYTAATPSDYSTTTTPGYSAANRPSLSVANTPGQPPNYWIPPYISACDVFDGVFVSLRNIPVNNRKATRDKIVELVRLLSHENVDPTLVNFSVMEK